MTVACDSTPCLRSGVLHVTATIADDAEVLGAEVTLDLGGPAVSMARTTETTWVADVQLGSLPFETFEADVVVTVVARDGARNVNSAGTTPTHVTRLRWVYDAGAPMSSPSVMADGTVVVGLSKTSLQVLAVNADGTKRWEATTGSRFITAAPAVGERAIWVADDRNVYALDPTSAGTLQGIGVAMDGEIKTSLTTIPELGKEWGVVGALSGRVGAASTNPLEYARSGAG
ncbi:MAG TPA: PQQ-binding-like beta-propeller repeat protein, partial [Anaeromyxobacter sp.]